MQMETFLVPVSGLIHLPAIASMLGIAMVLYVWILWQHQVSLRVSSPSFFCTSTKYEPHWFDTAEGDFIP